MEEDDWIDLLTFMRGQMRENGLDSLDEETRRSMIIDPDLASEGARALVLSYLDSLERQLELRSAGNAGRILEQLNEFAETDEGEPIGDILFELPLESRVRQGGSEVSLVDDRLLDDSDIPLVELRSLRSELEGS